MRNSVTKRECVRKRLSFQDDYGNRFGRKRELDGTVLTILERFRAREIPIRPKLLQLCIKSRESQRKKSRWCSQRKDLIVFTEESGSGTRERW